MFSFVYLLSNGMATSPDCETAILLTLESLWTTATGVRMLRRSQMRALRSSEPETTFGTKRFLLGFVIVERTASPGLPPT